MDSAAFDRFVRFLGGSASRRGALGVLGGLLLPLDAAGRGKHKQRKHKGKGKAKKRATAQADDRTRITICHAPGTPLAQTMVIPRTKLNAHVRDGDSIGPCPCTPTTCAALGKQCGSWPDGCGQTLTCGPCTSGQTCSSNGACVCTPNCTGKCGGASDGCGGTCDTCESCVGGCACVGGVCVPCVADGGSCAGGKPCCNAPTSACIETDVSSFCVSIACLPAGTACTLGGPACCSTLFCVASGSGRTCQNIIG